MGHCGGQIEAITMVQARDCCGLDKGDANESREVGEQIWNIFWMMEKTY